MTPVQKAAVRVRKIANGGLINTSYRRPPGQALDLFRADLKLLCNEALPIAP